MFFEKCWTLCNVQLVDVGARTNLTPPRKPTDGTPVFHSCLHQAQSDKSRRGEVLPAMILLCPTGLVA